MSDRRFAPSRNRPLGVSRRSGALAGGRAQAAEAGGNFRFSLEMENDGSVSSVGCGVMSALEKWRSRKSSRRYRTARSLAVSRSGMLILTSYIHL